MFAAELFRAFHEATNQTVLVRIWLWDKSLFDLAFVKFLYHITPLATWTVWAMKVEDTKVYIYYYKLQGIKNARILLKVSTSSSYKTEQNKSRYL